MNPTYIWRLCRVILLGGMALFAIFWGQDSHANMVSDLPWLKLELVPGTEASIADTDLVPSPQRRAELEASAQSVVTMIQRNEIHILSSGSVVEQELEVRHFLTEDGVRDGGDLFASVRTLVDRLTIEEAWVRLPDGTRVDVAPDTIQVQSTPNPDIYSDSHTVIIPFPSLEVGASAVLRTSRERSRSEWPLPWSRMYFTSANLPIEQFWVTGYWEDETDRPDWYTDDPKLDCVEGESETGNNTLLCRRELIPAFEFEPNLSSWLDHLPFLVLTHGSSWGELAAKELALVDQQMANAGEIEAFTRKLIAGASTGHERLRRIHRFVADDVRYVAFEHGRAAVVPQAAQLTLERLYGDCKAKVTLFVAMARLAGLDATPVLVSTGRYNRSKATLPSWLFFDHMIACVDGLERESICIDLTDPASGTGDLPVSLAGALALPLRADQAEPVSLPVTSHPWDYLVEANSHLACDGSIEEKLSRTYMGPGAASVRAAYSPKNAQDLDQLLRDGYEESLGKPSEQQFDVRGLKTPDQPVTIESTSRFTGDGLLASRTRYTEGGVWLAEFVSSAHTKNRKLPFHLEGMRVRTRATFQVCDEIKVGYPGPRLQFDSDFGHLTRAYEIEGNTVTVKSQLDMPTQEVLPDQLDRYRRFVEQIYGESRIWFSLEPREESGR